jgi:hypothetical protein
MLRLTARLKNLEISGTAHSNRARIVEIFTALRGLRQINGKKVFQPGYFPSKVISKIMEEG